MTWRQSLTTSYKQISVQPVSKPQLLWKNFSWIYCWACYSLYEWSHPCQFGSAVAALSPLNFLVTPAYLLAMQIEKQRKPCCCVNPAQQQLKPWCATNTVLLTNPNHSTLVGGLLWWKSTPSQPLLYTVVQYLRKQISVTLSSALNLRMKQYSIENNVIVFCPVAISICFNK